MILKSMPFHPSDLFSWKAGTGVAEASDFGRGNPITGQVYDDACDVGFIVASVRTAKEVVFSHHHDDRDSEHELQGSWYYSLPDRRHREGGEFKILIIND